MFKTALFQRVQWARALCCQIRKCYRWIAEAGKQEAAGSGHLSWLGAALMPVYNKLSFALRQPDVSFYKVRTENLKGLLGMHALTCLNPALTSDYNLCQSRMLQTCSNPSRGESYHFNLQSSWWGHWKGQELSWSRNTVTKHYVHW